MDRTILLLIEMLGNVREQLWFVVEQFYDPVDISVAFPCAFWNSSFIMMKHFYRKKKPTAINVRALTYSAI